MAVAARQEISRAAWEEDGFVLFRGFASVSTCRAMQARIVELARDAAAGRSIAPAYLQHEARLLERDVPPEGKLSKLFRVHRQEPLFRDFCESEEVLSVVRQLLGENLDCFLSQFIFKHPGAMGQPWHQDGFYFPFDKAPQVGVWLAITESTTENGPLWILPGSHRETIHEIVPDRRPGANLGYVEIVDHDMHGATPVLMEPGDCLFFHSHLMHRSTDNESPVKRAAMVFHYTEGGTIDGTEQRWGFNSPNNDFLPVLRDGSPPTGA